jgi:aryl-phospho-beta-D-glucosidase BglC (GH1 family)
VLHNVRKTFTHFIKTDRSISALLAIVFFALIGVYVISLSHAASPYASVESTSGVLGIGATLQTSSSASDGKDVQFGTYTNPTQPPGNGQLSIHVSGNQLVDASGTTIWLHGADVSGTEFSCTGNDGVGVPPDGSYDANTLTMYQQMLPWHINAVRIPLNEDCWLGLFPSSQYGSNGINVADEGANYQTQIEEDVAAANKAGLYVILDLHFSAPGNFLANNQQAMADADHSVTFWQQVATAFKANPATIFDLYNEPHMDYIADGSNPWACWLNGCEMNQVITSNTTQPDGTTTGYSTDYDWQTAGMQQLINTVRGTGATNPLLISGVGWAGDDSQWMSYQPTDPDHQIIVGAHVYPSASTPQVPTSSCTTAACWDGVFAYNQPPAITQKYPLVVGETGDNSAAPVSSFFPAFFGYADSQSWSYLAWTWNNWDDTQFVLIKPVTSTPSDFLNPVPTTGEGAYYKNHLLTEFP